MDKTKLNKILENHKHWLKRDCVGWEDMRANLTGVDLRGVKLISVDLRYAILTDADLRGVDLRGVKLTDAILTNAKLTDAILTGVDLTGVKLRGANLTNADLRGVKLTDADLIYADLTNADLTNADLTNADLTDADLRGADLEHADLTNADLTNAILLRTNLLRTDLTNANLIDAILINVDLADAENLPFIPYYCPESGSFIGYKKVSNYIVELEILKDAKRLSGISRKCRCDKAKVLRILNYDKSISNVNEVISDYDNTFIYKVGEIVSVNDFNEDRWDNRDARGINFFINFQEAVNY